MSHRTRAQLLPAPERITLDTLPELFARNRARFGGYRMSVTPPEPSPANPPAPAGPPAPAARPEGVSEQEWSALGDAGQQAIVRERERANAAERALAASRARPAPPKDGPPKPGDGPKPGDPPKPSDGPKPGDNKLDVAALIEQAVTKAVQPFVQRDQEREAATAASRIQEAVTAAAKDRFHDATDALSIDLASVTDGQGGPDTTKIGAALEDLLKRKPHLGKDPRPHAAPGYGAAQPAGPASLDERVKAQLAEMQAQTGVRTTS